jgi:hypothetical protein
MSARSPSTPPGAYPYRSGSREDEQRTHRRSPVPARPRRSRALIAIAVVLLAVVAVVLVFRLGVHAPPKHSGDAIVLATSGSRWSLHPAQYFSSRLITTVNGTVSGNFTTSGVAVDFYLMNETQYNGFVNDTPGPPSTNATGYTHEAGFAWPVKPAGTYFLVAWNIDTSHTTAVEWVTSLQWVPKG